MTYIFKQLYNKYFQKSKSFLFPILGIKKDSPFYPIQCYLEWEGICKIGDRKLIVTYKKIKSKAWDSWLVKIIMANKMFNNIHDTEDPEIIAISFDLNCFEKDYDAVVEGKYSELSKIHKRMIRDYYGYNSPEWAYMESFLFPDKYIATYSELLAVDESHIKVTGQLCDKPDLEKETLKLKPHASINDVDQVFLESSEDIQTNPNS
jgi:Fe-S cluster biosynthesis and repair protein YggX